MKRLSDKNLKRIISVCILFFLLFSSVGIPMPIAYAAENDFEKVTFSLNSTVVDDASLELYLYDSVHYISIDDLCELTRCSQSVDGNVISVTQGLWRASFDVEKQLFDDGCQSVAVTILEVSTDKFAVPALMFLSYYKAIAFIENDTLYCRMPEYTAWEALNIDYANSLVDIYELYGGEGNVKLSLTLDIIMDFIMGDMSTSDDYMSDAFLSALKVDLYSYSSVQEYKVKSQNKLYSDLHSGEGLDFVEALEDTLSIAAEPTEWYIKYYYNAIEKSFASLAYDAYEAGQHADVSHYGEKFYEAFNQKNRTSEAAEKYFENMDYIMLFVSAAADIAQEMKYVSATNNLVYNVMGQENLNYLGISADDNDWFTIANRYQNILGITATQLEAEAMQLFTDKLCWETLIGTGVSSAAGISGGAWTFSLNISRLFVENYPLTSSSVEAFKADRRALYLAELQQNVYWVAQNALWDMQVQRDNIEIYSKYIQAMQLYCRTSIAMCEKLITMVEQFGQNKDYWTNFFKARIDMLAVSLYQLTTIQDDGVNNCLPLNLSTFEYYSDTENIFAMLPSEFIFSSGFGAWGTVLNIESDGTFTGKYQDSNMGESGSGYSNGTVYFCNFSGKFTIPQKINEYVYSMNIEFLDVEGISGTIYYENDIRYIVSEPYGLDNANELFIYLPGASRAVLPDRFLTWTDWNNEIQDTLPSGFYGIYNVGGEKGFVGRIFGS